MASQTTLNSQTILSASSQVYSQCVHNLQPQDHARYRDKRCQGHIPAHSACAAVLNPGITRKQAHPARSGLGQAIQRAAINSRVSDSFIRCDTQHSQQLASTSSSHRAPCGGSGVLPQR